MLLLSMSCAAIQIDRDIPCCVEATIRVQILSIVYKILSFYNIKVTLKTEKILYYIIVILQNKKKFIAQVNEIAII